MFLSKSILTKTVTSLLLILVFASFFPKKINLVIADLGQHLKTGEIFFNTGRIIKSNYYSYTEPDRPAVNHRWLSGVIFYVVYKYFDFVGLSIFFALLSGVTLFIFFRLIHKKVGFVCATALIFLASPFILSRVEIRPEVFSYLFTGFYLYLFTQYREGGLKFNKLLIIVFLIQVLWVNAHLFFVIGIFLSLVFAFNFYLENRYDSMRNFLSLSVLLVVASLINPSGIHGVFEPFAIFREYGVDVKENVGLINFFSLASEIPKSKGFLFMFFTVFILGIFSGVFVLRRFKNRKDWAWLILFIIFGSAPLIMIRMVAMFGYYSILYFGTLLANFPVLIQRASRVFRYFIPFFIINGPFLFPNYGVGLRPAVQDSANFFKSNNLHGPIFNNYDIGGYLIYNLFPDERVFIDNRPEAYSVSFAGKATGRLGSDESAWEKLDMEYRFNTIYLSLWGKKDSTKEFLFKRFGDAQWSTVFMDGYAIILVRDIPEFDNVVHDYRISNPSERYLSEPRPPY